MEVTINIKEEDKGFKPQTFPKGSWGILDQYTVFLVTGDWGIGDVERTNLVEVYIPSSDIFELWYGDTNNLYTKLKPTKLTIS